MLDPDEYALIDACMKTSSVFPTSTAAAPAAWSTA
jgi:hypothetical protein